MQSAQGSEVRAHPSQESHHVCQKSQEAHCSLWGITLWGLTERNYRNVAKVFMWLHGSYVTKSDLIKRTSLVDWCHDCFSSHKTFVELWFWVAAEPLIWKTQRSENPGCSTECPRVCYYKMTPHVTSSCLTLPHWYYREWNHLSFSGLSYKGVCKSFKTKIDYIQVCGYWPKTICVIY